jgi:RNA polymerase sigma-70 factor (ECF subfamily)
MSPELSFFTTPEEFLLRSEQDRALLRKVASGDEEALSDLYGAYAPLVVALAVRMLRSVADAEDVLQEVFLETWRNAPAAGDGALLPRLVSLARERALLRLRARGHRRGHHALESGVALGQDARSFAQGSAFARVIAALPVEEQHALSLTYYDGFTIAETAAVLRSTPDAVHARIGAALTALNSAAPLPKITLCSDGASRLGEAAAAALGALAREEAAGFEAHAGKPCEACRSNQELFRETVALLPFALPHAPLSPEVKERILFAIRLSQVAAVEVAGAGVSSGPDTGPASADAPTEPESGGLAHTVPPRPWLMIVGVFAGLLVLVGLAAYVNTLIEHVDRQRTFILDQETAMAKLTTDLDGARAVLGLLESSRLEIYLLQGVGGAAGSHGKLLWEPGRTEAVLQVSRLGSLPPGKEYRLRVVFKEQPALQVGLEPMDSTGGRGMYFILQNPSRMVRSRIEYFALEVADRAEDSTSAGEVVMIGSPPRR